MQKGSENMNKIFKVIWSKTRNCYVVASELAKGRTKAASTGDKAKRLTLAAITALMLLPVGGYSYATINSATINDTSVITGTQEDANNISGTVMKATNNARDIGDLKTAMQSVETELAQHQSVIANLGTDKLTLSSDNTLQKETYDSATKTTTTTDVTGLKVAGPVSANSASISGTLSAGGAVNAGSVNSRGNITAVGTIAGQTVTATGTIKGKDLIGSNSIISQGTIAATGNISSQATVGAKEMVSQTNITAKNKVVGMQGVVDNTLTSGHYVTAGNTVGENIVALDTQVKANADAVATKANAADVYTKTETDSKVDAVKKEATTYTYRKVASEEAARKAADNELNERITNEANAIHETTNQLQSDLSEEAKTRESKDNELNERITNEANAIHDEIKAGDTALDNRITAVKESLQQEAADTYVSKADASVQDGAIVKADKTIGENVTNLDAALAKETADRLGADKAQDKVIQQVNQNMVDGFNTINKNMADGFTALNQADANEAAAREAADTTLQTNIDNEAAERKAADTVLDDKITAETSARVAADTKLVEAVNSGLSLSNDNVLQKNTTTIDAQGNVTTSKTDANEMILNKGKDNQITLNKNGIKVGTNSSVMDADGIYTGGDTFDAAKAAMSSDGQIKGANGKFTVDASGNTTVTSLDAGTGTIQTKGDLYAKDATFSGDITAKDATLSGDLSAKDGTFSGDLSAKDGTFSGDVSAKDVTATGTLQGAEVTDGTATMKNGNITGVKDLSAETITTSGNATIGGDLTVNGKLNVDEIDLTKNGIVGDNNVTASTKVAAGEITSYKKATSTKDGSEKESAIDYDENGTSTWAKSTDADSNWNKSTLTVEGNDVTSKVIDSEKNSNLATQTSIQSQSTLTDADKNTNTATQSAAESSSVLSDKDGNNTSSFRQRIDQILQEIKSANGSTSVEQNDVNITNTAANGTITNDAKALVNKASDSITSQIGDGSAVKSVMDANGIANTATGGTISNSAANISNTTTGNMTNTVGGNLIDTIMGTSTTTVTGKVTEDYKSDLSTKVGGDETHAVTGNQTTTVSGNRTVNVKGTETENFNALETNVKTDQKTSVGGNQTTIVTGNQTNNVSGSKTETVKGSVTEKYGSQATTVDGDQSTNIGGNQTTVVAKDQTNTVSGNKTETVKGAVNETYGSQTTKVNGDQSTTVTGKQTNSITGDQVNTIGGSQTTTVTGDSSLSAKNITNTASEKITNQIGDGSAVKSEMTADGITNTAEGGTIYNKSKDILNEASGDILNFADGEIGNVATKITNITGNNTVTSDTNGTTFENKAHNAAIKEGTVTKTTISGNTITTGEAVMDYADVLKDLGVRGNAAVDGNTTLGKEGAETTLTVNSTSTFNKDVTMKENATVAKDLSVGGNASVSGSVTASSYKVGDKTYISESGINANNQKVVNVAPGQIAADSKDAINGSQLYQTNERVTSVENRVGTVENRVDKLDSRVDKVGANAAALANLHPLEFDADSKWNIAAAVGGYKGETATAIGAFYRPNENVMVNVSSSFGTGENMYGGGISLRIGQGGNKARRNATNGLTEREKAMQKQIDSLTSRLDALLSVINPNMSKDFPDVPENHWAYEAVSRLAGNGVIQGYEDGKYHGDRTMTRYEMAEIIYNALSKGAKAEKKLVEEFKPELQAMAAQKKA